MSPILETVSEFATEPDFCLAARGTSNLQTDRKAIDKAARDRNGREFQPIKHIGVATITAHEASTGIFGTIGSPGSFPFGDGASDPLRCRRKDKVMRREQLVEAIPVAPACLEARLQNLLRWQGKPFGRIEGEPLRHATGHDIVPHFLRFLDGSA